MDFDLSDEQRLLKESVDRLVADAYDFESRKRHQAGEDGFSREVWRQFAELGLLALPFAEELGGIGGGPVETMIVMEALGRGLALEPFLGTVVIGGAALRHADRAVQEALIPRIASGEAIIALAQVERQSRFDLFDIATKATRDGSGYLIDGEKGVVVHGESADKLLVTARTAGSRRDREGIGLFLVDAKEKGVARRGYATQDGQRAAEISLTSARAEAVIGDGENGLPLIEEVVDVAIAALSAEAVGTMEEMHRLTIAYLKERKQFGMPIGAFQVLQHRGADMFIALEQARSMAMFATMMAEGENAAERRKAISAAKVQLGRSIRFVGQQAIQLHGGVGMTMEFTVGRFFKRATMIDLAFGDADHHLALLAASGGLMAA